MAYGECYLGRKVNIRRDALEVEEYGEEDPPEGNGAAQKQYGLSTVPGHLPSTSIGTPLPDASPGQRVWARQAEVVTMPDAPQLLSSAS